MRFISRSYSNLERFDEARMWINKAINEAPYLREPFVEAALLEYKLENWEAVFEYCHKALKIKTHNKSYINESFSFDHTIYDLLSLYYYNEQDLELSLIFINRAIKNN